MNKSEFSCDPKLLDGRVFKHGALIVFFFPVPLRFRFPSLHPDWMLLLSFTHTHVTITMTLALLFLPKVLGASWGRIKGSEGSSIKPRHN